VSPDPDPTPDPEEDPTPDPTPERVVSQRFGRILCDDELEDELIGKLAAWATTFQAEIERQRGWDARTLDAPRSIIPVALFERSHADSPPCITVYVQRIEGVTMGASRAATMDWRVGVEVIASGADVDDTRKRVRAHVAAIRTLLLQMGGSGPLITNMRLVSTEYTPTLEQNGRTLGAGVMEFVASVNDTVTKWRGGKSEPPEDPYDAPADLVAITDTNVTMGQMP